MTVAAVIPDVDGLGIIAEMATGNSSNPVYWWSEYHHVLCHNLGFGLLVMIGSAALAVRRTTTVLLVLLVFHLLPPELEQEIRNRIRSFERTSSRSVPAAPPPVASVPRWPEACLAEPSQST